jgi:hypothetical protein
MTDSYQIKQAKFEGFFKTIRKNYLYTILFFILIIGLVIGLQYAQKKLEFNESKMILGWFAFIIIANLIITYTNLIMYKQIKTTVGIQGPKGYDGPHGDQGAFDSCAQCGTKDVIFEQIYAEPGIAEPILPEKIDTRSVAEKRETGDYD